MKVSRKSVITNRNKKRTRKIF